MANPSFRSRLRAFRAMRGEPPDPGFIADLECLENRDLDPSIRLGAMLAFNAWVRLSSRTGLPAPRFFRTRSR